VLVSRVVCCQLESNALCGLVLHFGPLFRLAIAMSMNEARRRSSLRGLLTLKHCNYGAYFIAQFVSNDRTSYISCC
jgi:hypothetical protein